MRSCGAAVLSPYFLPGSLREISFHFHYINTCSLYRPRNRESGSKANLFIGSRRQYNAATMSLTSRFRIAACSGALAVVLGAFGAHSLRETLSAHQTADIWETAAFYHFIHTLALLWCADQGKSKPWWCFLFGIAVFSGSLYLLAISGWEWLGAVAPVGGASLILGWLWLAASFRKPANNDQMPARKASEF